MKEISTLITYQLTMKSNNLNLHNQFIDLTIFSQKYDSQSSGKLPELQDSVAQTTSSNELKFYKQCH
jgi:hypothetical protein